MKNARIIACALFFVSVAGSAHTSSKVHLTRAALASILGQPAVAGSCATQQSWVPLTAKPPSNTALALCTATAHCASGTVSCQGNNSTASCTAVDRNCPNDQGHVTCDGVTTRCPTVCPVCNNCCQCDQTGDCFACCRCGGGGGGHCALLCG
jgi:hypothetical protein